MMIGHATVLDDKMANWRISIKSWRGKVMSLLGPPRVLSCEGSWWQVSRRSNLSKANFFWDLLKKWRCRLESMPMQEKRERSEFEGR